MVSREFTLAEIEHFVHPEKKNHFKFDLVKDIKLTLFPQQQQTSTAKCIKISVEEAVNDKIIDNQTLAYYMARTYLFLLHIGVHEYVFQSQLLSLFIQIDMIA